MEQQQEFWAEIERENKLKKIIKKYDVGQDGKLSPSELGGMLQDLAGGHPPTEEEMGFVMKSADINKDGFISK